MNIQSKRLHFEATSLSRSVIGAFNLFGVLFISIISGMACAVLPWFIAIGFILGVLYFVLLWLRPWIGLYTYILAALFAPDFKISDAATVVTLGVCALRGWSAKNRFYWVDKQLLSPYLLFLSCVFVSLVIGVYYFHNNVPYLYRDGRVFLYWLWLPIIGGMVSDSPLGLTCLGRVALAVAITVAMMAIFQAVTGIQIVAVGRVGALETTGADQSEFVRVQMPGFAFVVWGVVWLALSMAQRKVDVRLGAILSLVFVCGLLVNFGRALWVWTLVALLISMLLIEKRRALVMLCSLIIVGISFSSLILLTKPELADAVIVRITSVEKEGGGNTSYGLRQWENENALARLSSSPIVGVGMGGEYRTWVPVLRMFEDHTRYIHNSYLFLSLKIGLPGLFVVLWLLVIAWLQAFRNRKCCVDENHVFTLVSVATLPALLGLCITQPELMSTYSVVCFVLILVFLRPPTVKRKPENQSGRWIRNHQLRREAM